MKMEHSFLKPLEISKFLIFNYHELMFDGIIGVMVYIAILLYTIIETDIMQAPSRWCKVTAPILS